jgi:DNA-binding MarR family transcriptional regulator
MIYMGANVSPSRATRGALDAVRRIVHALRESSRRAEKHVGLSGAQLFVLQKLAEQPGSSINALAACTHTHQSSVSAVVSRLVGRRLVRRTQSGTDGRSVQLSLTPNGRRLVDRAPDVAQGRLIRGIESLPPVRRRQLASALGELALAMDTVDRAPVMFFEERGRRRRKAAARA